MKPVSATQALQTEIEALSKDLLAGVWVFVKDDGVTVETENGESVPYADLQIFKTPYTDTILNTENIAVQIDKEISLFRIVFPALKIVNLRLLLSALILPMMVL